MDSFFAFVMFMAGIYMLYAALRLKREGYINPSFMRTPKGQAKRIKDKDGYVAFMFPKALGLSIITLAIGAWFLLTTSVMNLAGQTIGMVVEIGLVALYFGYLFWYTAQIKKAESMFCV